MASVLKRRGRIQVRLEEREREALLGMLDDPRWMSPVVAAPRAYEDRDMQAEYERWVRPDIEQGHESDLGMVREALGAGDDVIELSEAQALAWLRGFNQLRLRAATLLGFTDDGWEESADEALRARPEFGMLIVLGWFQEELLAALDT